MSKSIDKLLEGYKKKLTNQEEFFDISEEYLEWKKSFKDKLGLSLEDVASYSTSQGIIADFQKHFPNAQHPSILFANTFYLKNDKSLERKHFALVMYDLATANTLVYDLLEYPNEPKNPTIAKSKDELLEALTTIMNTEKFFGLIQKLAVIKNILGNPTNVMDSTDNPFS